MHTQAPTNLQHLQSIKEKTIAFRNLLLTTPDSFRVDIRVNIANAVYVVIEDLVSGLNCALDDIYTLAHLSEYPANQTLISNEELDGTLILLGTTLRLAVHQITSYYSYNQLNGNSTYTALVELEAHVSVMTRALQKLVADAQVNDQQARWGAGVPHPDATHVSDRLKAFEQHKTAKEPAAHGQRADRSMYVTEQSQELNQEKSNIARTLAYSLVKNISDIEGKLVYAAHLESIKYENGNCIALVMDIRTGVSRPIRITLDEYFAIDKELLLGEETKIALVSQNTFSIISDDTFLSKYKYIGTY